MPRNVVTIDVWKSVAEWIAGMPVGSPPFAEHRKWLPGRRSGQFHLGPDEGGIFRLIVFIEPVRENEAGRIVIGIFANRGNDGIVIGHESILSCELSQAFRRRHSFQSVSAVELCRCHRLPDV